MKRAIIAVSVGTIYERAFTSELLPMEQAIRVAYKGCKVIRAYTSAKIREFIKEQYNITVDSPAEAIIKLLRGGYSNIIVQPLFLVPGIEYEKLEQTVDDYKSVGRDISLSLGKPLLYSEQDIYEIAMMLIHSTGVRHGSDTANVFVGHGTMHNANVFYYRLLKLINSSSSTTFLTVIENEPSFESVVDEVISKGLKKVVLRPFMLAVGGQALNAMAADTGRSLKNLFVAKEVACECEQDGLGGYDVVQEIFLRHITEAEPSSVYA